MCSRRYAHEAAAAAACPPLAALTFSALERRHASFGYCEGGGEAAEAAALLAGLRSVATPPVATPPVASQLVDVQGAAPVEASARRTLPLLASASPFQLAPLPPPPGSRIQRTWPHSHASVTLVFRETDQVATSTIAHDGTDGGAHDSASSPATVPPIVVQQDGSRATHGGQLAAITQSVLRSLTTAAAAAASTAAATASAAAPSTVPALVPIAHLGTFLFPTTGGEFAIFEPRYRLLFARVVSSGALFAVGPGAMAEEAEEAAEAEVGSADTGGRRGGLATLAALEEHEHLPDGRLRVKLRGLRRFTYRIPTVQPASFGLWCAAPAYIDDDRRVDCEGEGGAAREKSLELGTAGAVAALAATAELAAAEAAAGETPPLLGAELVAELEAAARRHGWSKSAIDEVAGLPPLDSAADLSWWFAHVLPAPHAAKREWFKSRDAHARLRAMRDWMRNTL